MNCLCGTRINPKRVALGYQTCPVCGDREARQVKFTTVPLNKSNYVVVSDYRELAWLNPKNINTSI
jgi:hypothetical protein